MTESWRSKRDKLCKLIKTVSDQYGGDDRDWLREYARDVINLYTDDLDSAILCFDSLIARKRTCLVSATEARMLPSTATKDN